MKVRRFTDEGMVALHEWLDALDSTPTKSARFGRIEEETITEPIGLAAHLDHREFSSRLELGAYIANTLAGVANLDVTRDPRLWSWVAVFYFDQLCPHSGDGSLRPGERARWVPAMTDWRKYYRHLVAGPYSIYMAHRDAPHRVMAVLSNPVDQPGELYEQLASRMELATSPTIMELATRLYVEPESGRLRRGAATKGPGGARRLADVLSQFDLSWDLRSISTDSLLDMLPIEFDQYRQG